jgi:RNA ligase
MIQLHDMLDVDALGKLIDEKVIAKRLHPDAPLHLYDYTPKAQYERIWTPETIACRGLVVHNDGRVWARPFGKFFNAGEHGPGASQPALPVHESFEVFDKLDGSLGIAYRNPKSGEICISTRGSFASDQAIHATEILRTRYAYLDSAILPNETWLFEIIYPTNRIVVNYGDQDDLVLLAMIDTTTGADLPLPSSDRWTGPIVTRHDNLADWAEVAQAASNQTNGDDAEGYVVRFASGVRTKVKFEDYLRLHRLVTGVSSVTIWEHLMEARPFDDLLHQVPDEFYGWVKQTAADLRRQFDEIERACRAVVGAPEVDAQDRKATALFFANKPFRAVLFKMFDKRPYDELIWKEIRPEFARPFRTGED